MTMPSGAPRPEYYDAADSDNVCFLCGQPQYERVYEVRHFGFPFTFQRCQCGLIKQTPMPNEAFFEWFFNSDVFFSDADNADNAIWGYHDFFADESSRMATSRYRYRKLAPLLERGSPLDIMKIGPSTGTFLHVAQQHGHRAIGCDISARFIAYARDHYNVHVDQGRFEHQPYADEQFDVVVLFNVIENVPNQAEFLAAIQRTVKRGGLFILNLVDMRHNVVAAIQRERYFLYRPPVCYIFDLNVARAVLKKFGFDIVTVHRDVRYMHCEKILTLLGWRRILSVLSRTRLQRVPFPLYAYPSRIVVARRVA